MLKVGNEVLLQEPTVSIRRLRRSTASASRESGRFRYGVRAIEEDPDAQMFLRTLQRISLAVQREQLQRSGAVR